MVKNNRSRDLLPSLTDRITFNIVDVNLYLREKNRIRALINTIAVMENKVFGFLSYNFCSDEYLLKINKKHLNHNNYTDIITFDLSEEGEINGDIYISVERVKENSAAFKQRYTEELSRVMIHGFLHLCGYKDKTDKDISIIRKKENQYLSLR